MVVIKNKIINLTSCFEIILFLLFFLFVGCFSERVDDEKSQLEKKINQADSKNTKINEDETSTPKSINSDPLKPDEIFEPINVKGTIRFKLNCYETALKDLILIFGNKIIDGEIKFVKEDGVYERRLKPRIKKDVIELGNLAAGEYLYKIVGPRVRIMKPRKITLPQDKGLTVEVKDFEAWKVFIMTDVPLSKLSLSATLKFPNKKNSIVVNRKYYDYFSVYIKDEKPLKFDFKSGVYSNNGPPNLEHVEGTLYIFNIKLKKPE